MICWACSADFPPAAPARWQALGTVRRCFFHFPGAGLVRLRASSMRIRCSFHASDRCRPFRHGLRYNHGDDGARRVGHSRSGRVWVSLRGVWFVGRTLFARRLAAVAAAGSHSQRFSRTRALNLTDCFCRTRRWPAATGTRGCLSGRRQSGFLRHWQHSKAATSSRLQDRRRRRCARCFPCPLIALKSRGPLRNKILRRSVDSCAAHDEFGYRMQQTSSCFLESIDG